MAVRYRLAPQYETPANVLDVLVAFFSLISPQEGAFHSPIPANEIVFAGDSSGASLCLAAIQVILCLRRLQSQAVRPTICFNEVNIPLDLPAGFTGLSPGIDATMSLPSNLGAKGTDYMTGNPPYLRPDCPSDSIWPSKPPRGEIHCDVSALCHPLVSPVNADDWKGAPLMWIACGQETLQDASKLLAQLAARQGVPVQFEQYEYMPHVFAWILGRLPGSQQCIKSWGAACRNFVAKPPHCVRARATFYGLGDLRPTALDLQTLSNLTREEAKAIMRSKRRQRENFVWTGPRTEKSSL